MTGRMPAVRVDGVDQSDGVAVASDRQVDLRLAAAALPGWGGAAAALLLPTWVAVLLTGAGLAVIVAAGSGAAIARRSAAPAARRIPVGAMRLALVAASGAVLVLAPMLPRLADSRQSALARLARDDGSAQLELVLQDDPRVLASTGQGPPRIIVRAEVRSGSADGKREGRGEALPLRGRVLVIAGAEGWLDLLPGQRLRVSGDLDQPRRGSLLSAVVYADDAPELLGRPPAWQRAAGAMRASLRDAVGGLAPGPRGLLPGLVVGDTSRMDPVLAQRFDAAGMSHLLAVSGTNCSILIGAVVLALRRGGVRPRTCAVVAAIALVGFVVLARPSPSVVRAAAMASVALIALALGRERTAIPALSFAVLALLAWQPQWALDGGFAMSVAATAALLLVAPGWAQRLRERGVPPILAEALALSAAASAATLPIIVAIGGPLSIVTVPANMLAEPAVPIATILGLVVALIAPVHLGAAQLLAQAAAQPCRWLIAVAERFGALDGAALPWPSGPIGALALLAALALIVLAVRRGLGPALLGAVLVAGLVQIPIRALTSSWPPGRWAFVACDVGEGDALVLRAGPGSAVVIDTGGDPLTVDACLRRLGVVDIPLLVITHLHADHAGGVAGVFHGRQVGQVVTSPLREPPFGLAAVIDALAAHGRSPADLITPAIGSTARFGEVGLEFVWPRRALRGTHSDPNNSSLIIRARVHGISILLTGDSEVEEQEAMLAAGLDLRADILKAPHHGSRFVSADFLAAVRAQAAVISVGQPNDYGHPAPALLDDLRRVGIATVLRTDQTGDVALAKAGDPGGDGAITARARGRGGDVSALASLPGPDDGLAAPPRRPPPGRQSRAAPPPRAPRRSHPRTGPRPRPDRTAARRRPRAPPAKAAGARCRRSCARGAAPRGT